MIYYVKYADSFYKLYENGEVVQTDERFVTDYEIASADVIASWGYIHKLIEDIRESLEGELKAYPNEDTIWVRYFEDYSGQLTLDIRVDVSTVRTTMRKRIMEGKKMRLIDIVDHDIISKSSAVAKHVRKLDNARPVREE